MHREIHNSAAVDRWDRQTDKQMDGQTPYYYIDPAAYYASSVNIAPCIVKYTTVQRSTDGTDRRTNRWTDRHHTVT